MIGVMRMRKRKSLGALAADEKGTSIVELAMVAPLLSLVTMGIIDLSTGYGRRLELTEAASRTIEKVAANNFEIPAGSDGPDYSAIRADAAEGAGVPVSQVTVTRWLECDGVEQPSFEGTCPPEDRPECDAEVIPQDCLPVMARYIEVRIDDSFRPQFASIVAPGPNGTYPLFAEAAVRIQ